MKKRLLLFKLDDKILFDCCRNKRFTSCELQIFISRYLSHREVILENLIDPISVKKFLFRPLPFFLLGRLITLFIVYWQNGLTDGRSFDFAYLLVGLSNHTGFDFILISKMHLIFGSKEVCPVKKFPEVPFLITLLFTVRWVKACSKACCYKAGFLQYFIEFISVILYKTNSSVNGLIFLIKQIGYFDKNHGWRSRKWTFRLWRGKR